MGERGDLGFRVANIISASPWLGKAVTSIALEEEPRKSKLLRADKMDSTWTGISLVIKARQLSLSTQAAIACTRITDYHQLERLFNQLVYAALDDAGN